MQDKKAKLSKTILDMKFMKKTKERVQKEEEDAEGQTMYANEITEEMRKSEGRMSFGGMNPDIENYMATKYSPKLEEIERQMGTDVSDAEMAKGYSTLVNTMAKKFTDKKKRHLNS
ncbi:M-phase phosphoprotein 6 [Popillia japonica]|uniref:M-phase phosphoprotein 6 n=1 Tax=Popillia japonica TaxID=7064 RepID=A0AAW1KI66_POPJA